MAAKDIKQKLWDKQEENYQLGSWQLEEACFKRKGAVKFAVFPIQQVR